MKILALDCHYIFHRAWYALHKETDREIRAELLIPMVLRDISYAVEKFGVDAYVFAFDSVKSKRAEIYAAYKMNRKKEEVSQEEKLDWVAFRERLITFRDDVLPSLGYKNIFRVEGYEADDIIAKVCEDKRLNDSVVIVSSDKDLYQCLVHDGVVHYCPNNQRIMSAELFESEKGIPVSEYWRVKCLTGCSSDNIRGLYRIGEGRAISFLLGTLKKNSFYDLIINEGMDAYKRNKILVKIPFPGLESFNVQEDNEINERKLALLLDKVSVSSRRKVGGFV